MQYNEILKIVKKLRKNQTPAEKVLWEELRNRKFRGKKFLRQHPVIYETNNKELFFFVPDFYCAKHKLVIELDGDIHNYQKERDKNRDLILKDKGLKIIRIKNEELQNIEEVKQRIEQYF